MGLIAAFPLFDNKSNDATVLMVKDHILYFVEHVACIESYDCFATTSPPLSMDRLCDSMNEVKVKPPGLHEIARGF